MSWNWNKSGRVDSFYFEKISAKDINNSLGSLDCAVIGGTLNFSYYSDLKVSGSLEVVNVRSSMSEEEYLIRIWYTPTLDGEKQKINLGTFYFTSDLHYENGTYKGTLNLRSLLARHIDDVVVKKWSLSKNKRIAECYKDVFKALGGFPLINGVKNKKITKQHIFDVGTTPMEILQYIADYSNAEIVVNSLGQTVLQPYKSPVNKAKSISHIVTANSTSVIKAGLDITNSIKEIPNRVVCTYEQSSGRTSTMYIGKAALDSKEKRSKQKIGRWITQYYQVTNLSKPYVKNLKAKAAKYLKSLNHKKIYYEFETYYQPIEIGEVIRLKYDDIDVKGLVTDIDLDLSVGATMRIKIRKV